MAGLSEPRRLLIRGVNWLGDAVMTTPALARIRERLPGTHISLLTSRKLEPLWSGHPDLDEVLTFSPEEGFWSVGRRLREKRFDVALVLPNSPRSALESWWGRIPMRIGFRRAWRSLFLTRPVPLPPNYIVMRKRSIREIRRLLRPGAAAAPRVALPREAHHLHHYLHLAAVLGANPEPVAPRLRVSPEERCQAATKFHLQRFLAGDTGNTVKDSQPVLVGLNPGAEYGPAKRWPTAFFIDAAIRAGRVKHIQWVIFGGPADLDLAREIESGIRSAQGQTTVFNLAGQTTLRELMAVMSLCRVVLTNDTGPMHLAAALGSRVLVPFGSTSPELTGPGLPGDRLHRLLKTDIACAPCFLRQCPVGLPCMHSLSAERVSTELLGMLAPLPD